MTRIMDSETDNIRAQAAAWLARLHSDAPSPEDQAAFRRGWQKIAPSRGF